MQTVGLVLVTPLPALGPLAVSPAEDWETATLWIAFPVERWNPGTLNINNSW